MIFMIKQRRYLLLFIFVLSYASQIRSDDNAGAAESGGQGSNDVLVKSEKSNKQDNEGSANSEDEKENIKLEKDEQSENKKVEIKSDHVNREENDIECHAANDKVQHEKEEGNEQQQDEKSEDSKQEALNNDAAMCHETKKQIQKDDANRKTELNDVNAYNGKEDGDQMAKRETTNAYSEFLGLPRDAGYFFDDLEPFFNNYTDTRVGRAAPSRETKIQKTRLSGKGKDSVDEDTEEEEEEEVNDEEKLNEEEYDDDEDADSDCQPTTGCSTTTTCPTTTTKCTTTPACTTTERRCPKLCVKGNKKKMGYQITSEKTVLWDADKKKINFKKRRHFGKLNSGVMPVV